MITGALILLVGIVIGVVLRSLPARRKGPKPIQAVCGCRHHHAMHDPETSCCHARVDEAATYDEDGYPSSYVKVQCSCRRYSGPELYPTYIATEIAEEAGQ